MFRLWLIYTVNFKYKDKSGKEIWKTIFDINNAAEGVCVCILASP